MVQDYGGRVRFVVENYGASELARRFGVKRYPAIFAGDVLVATPKDFGFYGKGEGAGTGRYAPIRSASSHERFRSDLTRVIDLLLAGRPDAARTHGASPDIAATPSLPALSLTDVHGQPLGPEDLHGRIVLVEFWATWCSPCRSTLAWLAEQKKRHGDRVAIVTFAVESDPADVEKVSRSIDAPVRWIMGTPEIARAFGDVSGVPTLFLFDRQGKGVATFFGAPPTLHTDVEARLRTLLGP